MNAIENVEDINFPSAAFQRALKCVLLGDFHPQSSDVMLSFEPGVSDVFQKQKTDEAVCWRAREMDAGW